MANGIYRIPTKKGYAKTRIDKGKTWKDIYGNKKCFLCKKHFEELDIYMFVGNDTRKCQHLNCKNPKKAD